MKLIESSLKFISLIVSMLVVCGVIHLHIYYSYFSIPIWSFISMKEVLTFFIEDIMVWMTIIVLIFVIVYAVRKSSFYEEVMSDHDEGNISAPSLIGKNWLYFLFFPIQILLVVHLVSFFGRITSSEYGTMFRLLVTVVTLMMSVFVMTSALKKKLHRELLYATLGMIFILGLVEYSVDKAVRTDSNKRNTNIEVYLKSDLNENDYIFIGKTEKFIFLKEGDDILVLSADKVDRYKVRQVNSIYKF